MDTTQLAAWRFIYELTDIPEANDEVNRMEQVIYKKLIEIVSQDKVMREDR